MSRVKDSIGRRIFQYAGTASWSFIGCAIEFFATLMEIDWRDGNRMCNLFEIIVCQRTGHPEISEKTRQGSINVGAALIAARC